MTSTANWLAERTASLIPKMFPATAAAAAVPDKTCHGPSSCACEPGCANLGIVTCYYYCDSGYTWSSTAGCCP